MTWEITPRFTQKMSAVIKQSYSAQVVDYLQSASMNQALKVYKELIMDKAIPDAVIADVGKGDRFFLLSVILHRPDAIHPWLYDRCREVELSPDDHLDLWARDHYKSTIITFAGCIQEILRDPGITIGVFSHTQKISKKFVGQIKRELELNQYIKDLYPEILYDRPGSQALKWSEESLIVKRSANPAEATLEAWGLVDGQPIGKHFMLMVYDDVVVWESVQTSAQIEKTTTAWELSLNLADTKRERKWYIGTRYNLSDTYSEIMKRDLVTPRIYPATHNGTTTGRPVLITLEQLKKKLKMGKRTFACQQLQNPAAGSQAEFSENDFRVYEIRPKTLNVYITVDYAGSRNTGSSNTAMAVTGMDAQYNKYLLDGACHKMSLDERWLYLKHFHRKWINAPGVQAVKVGYERYGAQSDIEHCFTMMKIENYHFSIDEMNTPREGEISKDNRIRRLSPDHENWRYYYPRQPENREDITKMQIEAIRRDQAYLVAREIKHKNEDGIKYNLIEWFLANEYMVFPFSKQKDMLDAMSRVYDLDPQPPIIHSDSDVYPQYEES